MPAAGGTGRINVTTARECAWTATADGSWLSFVGQPNGQGDGVVEFRAAANPDPVTRRGAIALNDQRAEINQAAAECVITIREPSATFPNTGGSGVVNVSASSQMCPWTAAVDADWIALTSSANGSGTGSVRFTVAPTTGPPRTGTITVAGQRFSITQSEGCNYAIAPTSQTFGAAGGTGQIAVTTAPGCPWTSGSNVNWISISSGSTGSGPGSVAFSVAATAGPGRTGTIVAGGQTFTVTQSEGCSYQVAPLAQTVAASGGTGTVNVATSAGCSWTASSDAPWITISGGTAGNGNGTVTFAAAATTGPSRNGTLTVAGQRVSVTQSQGCTYAIDPTSQNVSAGGGSGAVNVTAGAGCAWTAATGADWITITEGRSGSGNGTVRFTAAATNGPQRAGTIAIAGQTFTLNQGQGCSFNLQPQNVSVPAAGGTRTFDIQAAAGCAWTSNSNANWISITQGSSGSGNGTIGISVAANTGPARTGTVTAGARTFTVNQDGGCTFSITPPQRSIDAAGGSVSVSVSGSDGCAWTATSNAAWIAITSGAAGTGGGTVELAIAANTDAARSGTVTIAGQMFTVTQASGCSFNITPDPVAAPASGGPVTLQLMTAATCTWTAASGVPWVAVVSGAGGTGPGAIGIAVEANTGPIRSGSLSIAGRMVAVTQESGCTYTLDAPGTPMPASGGSKSVVVTTAAGCTWTAVSQVLWISVTAGSSGNGPGTVQLAVEPNTTGAPRAGTVTIAGQTYTVIQGI